MLVWFVAACALSQHQRLHKVHNGPVWVTVDDGCCGTQKALAGQQYPDRACSSGQGVHVPPTKSRAGRPSKGKGRATNKRRRIEDDGTPEETDDGDGPNDIRGDQDESDTGGGPPSRFLDCPFHKFDPQRYHRCGGKYEMKVYRHVIHHLVRVHQMKDSYYCPRCWKSFSNTDPWRAHCGLATCELIPGPERLEQDEFEKLKKAVPGRGHTDEEKWFKMWDLFFAGHERPASAYVTDATLDHVRLTGLPELQARLPFLLLHHLNFQALDEAPLSALMEDIAQILLRPPEWTRRFRRAPGWPAGNTIAADVQYPAAPVDAGPSGSRDAVGGPQTQSQETAFRDDLLEENPIVDENLPLGNTPPQSRPVPDSSAFIARDEPSTHGADSASMYLPILDTAAKPFVAGDFRPRSSVEDEFRWDDFVDLCPDAPDAEPSLTLGSNAPQATYPPD